MGQLCDLEQVRGQTAHQLSGAVFVVVFKAQLLQVAEEILPDIRLHADAEGVAPVGDHKLQKRAQHIGQQHDPHDDEEGPVLLVGQQVVKGAARHEGKSQIDTGDGQRAEHVQRKKPLMRFEITHKDPQQGFILEFLCFHIRFHPLQYFGSTRRCGS